MVAISLYKANLQSSTKRWPCPRKISRKHFKILTRRRDKALSRVATDSATTFYPNHDPDPIASPKCDDINPTPASETVHGNHVDFRCSDSRLMFNEVLVEGEGEKEEAREEGKAADEISVENCFGELVEKSDALVVEVEQKDVLNVMNDGLANVPVNDGVENINVENATSHVEKTRKEIKDKLEILNEKKHSLVQVLKQILNAEDQLKGQNSMQGPGPSCPPAPLQVDNSTDSRLMIRVNTPRTGKDGNPCGYMEGGEADDISKDNTHSLHLPRISSTSPSSESEQRKPASNMQVPHSYRASIGVAGSPSRFALAAQGPPSVSVSGASYIASSPSPAASGGTSVFRESRLPSRWN